MSNLLPPSRIRRANHLHLSGKKRGGGSSRPRGTLVEQESLHRRLVEFFPSVVLVSLNPVTEFLELKEGPVNHEIVKILKTRAVLAY
jgi:hypothetical protein